MGKLGLIFLFVCCYQIQTHRDTIMARKSKMVVIKLPCNAGSGFSWSLSDSAYRPELEFVKQTYSDVKDGRPGSTGLQIFVFRTAQKGRKYLNFRYQRPFIKPQDPKASNKQFLVIIK